MRSKMIDLVPEVLLEDGNPTDEWLEFLERYTPDESLPVLKLMQEIFPNGWLNANMLMSIFEDSEEDIYNLELHTGGYCANEDVIEAVIHNFNFTNSEMSYIAWKRGGHYYFEIKK